MIIANNVLPNASPLCHDWFVDAFSFWDLSHWCRHIF